jgi:AcrR family transcriptional regulator
VILDAAVQLVRTSELDDITLPAVAAESGVALRTLYRYFATRDELLGAAGERLYAEIGVEGPEVVSGQSVAASFLAASERLAAHPDLARRLVRTTAGRRLRAPSRARRIASIMERVGSVAPPGSASDPGVNAAAAVVAHLCSAAAWVETADETGLSADQARIAVAWAIDQLTDAVARGDVPDIRVTTREKR